ncbi:MAG: PEP-CTERM sorting domain-containing protein [Microcystis aeruginosa]
MGIAGQGSLTFSKVPEPSIVIGLITLGGIGLVFRKSP